MVCRKKVFLFEIPFSYYVQSRELGPDSVVNWLIAMNKLWANVLTDSWLVAAAGLR